MKRFWTFLVSILIACSFFAWWQVFAADPCAESTAEDCITSDTFKISVWDITPWGISMLAAWAGEKEGTQNTVGNFLTVVLEKLIIAFGVLSILIMTVWAWYMIIYHGQDEFLSKWKSIFVSGLIALAVALSAWVIVRIFAYLLYSAT